MKPADNQSPKEPSGGFGFIILMMLAVIAILAGIKFAIG